MKITGMLLAIAVAGFYGCSDKKDAASGEDKTSPIEKAGQLGGEMADKVKQAATEAGDTASASLDKVADKVDETVATVESASPEAAVDDSIAPEQIAMGKTIYGKHCMACHAAGVAGAPKLSDAAVWEPRIAQGMDTLYGHAIKGFKGSMGYMPPKGGFATLDDDEVKAAVAYMVSTSQ